MKKLLFVFAVVLFAASCNQAGEQTEDSTALGITVVEFMDVAVANVDSVVTVTGLVNHVCGHTGMRCFLVDEENDLTLRIEAGEEIGIFPEDIIGKVIIATGIVVEDRVPKEEIDQMEADLLAEQDTIVAEEDDGHCDSELQNIIKMKDWMADNGKDYYSNFSIIATEYTVVEEEVEEEEEIIE